MRYADLEERFERSRKAFGHMLLCWRRHCGWTQYTACDWAKAADFEAISYGNLSVIEQGKAGELRQKAFFQLHELNRRIAEKDWGRIADRKLRERVKAAVPIGDQECPVWSAIEFWSCYTGVREIPEFYRVNPPPVLGQRKATELCGRWRRQLQEQVDASGVEPMDAIASLMKQAPAEHRERFFAVLTGFSNYSPDELCQLWLEADQYQPMQWLQAWQEQNKACVPASDTP